MLVFRFLYVATRYNSPADLLGSILVPELQFDAKTESPDTAQQGLTRDIYPINLTRRIG
jgi:hypothetical protein